MYFRIANRKTSGHKESVVFAYLCREVLRLPLYPDKLPPRQAQRNYLPGIGLSFEISQVPRQFRNSYRYEFSI